jgi:hypothetical protein
MGLGTSITGTVALEGLGCEGSLGDYCYSGDYEFRLTSSTLSGTPFHAGGTFCFDSTGTSTVASCSG